MKKFLVFILIIFLACLLAGAYGIVHDQLTYTISNEYYTKFKFYQFSLVEDSDVTIVPDPRLAVSLVGLMATWWMGIPIGVLLGMIGFIHADAKSMFIITMKAFLITIMVAFATGLAGLAYGFLVLGEQPASAFGHWYIPDNLVDFKNFIAVGSMHNFSYLGGILGLVAGGGYSVWKRTENRKKRHYKILQATKYKGTKDAV
jgi:hypothetical protein